MRANKANKLGSFDWLLVVDCFSIDIETYEGTGSSIDACSLLGSIDSCNFHDPLQGVCCLFELDLETLIGLFGTVEVD